MNIKGFTAIFLLTLVFAGCQSSNAPNNNSMESEAAYPAAEGFNAAASDSQAISIADSVMEAMGGYNNWAQTDIIYWNFFGQRTHTWNKAKGTDRIEIPKQNMVIDFDINTKEGTVTKNGEELSPSDSVKKYLQQAYEMWANDSYWLVMPYKLKDNGVTLKYMGTDSMQTGEMAYKLKLTFENVGVTPDNKYYVYVDTADYMVRQWAYFPEAKMKEPRFILPWKDYKKYGNIMLSGNRGENKLSDIQVMDSAADSLNKR